MAKLFKFEKVLKNLIDFYDDGILRMSDYPDVELNSHYNYYYNQYLVIIDIYNCVFKDKTHYNIQVKINNRVYNCLNFSYKPISVILDFLDSCLETY